MNVNVMVNGRAWKIAIEPARERGKLAVTLAGRTRVIDLSWVDADTLSLVDGDVVREIRLHPRGDDGGVRVEIAGKTFEAIASRQRTAAKGAGGTTTAAGALLVKAPMPGRIVRVLVGAGDRVTAREPVVVIEAMKMENELRSPRDGIVKEVVVAPGDAVETGAVLVIVDP